MNPSVLIINNRLINLTQVQEIKVTDTSIYFKFSNNVVYLSPQDLIGDYDFIIKEINSASLEENLQFDVSKALKYFSRAISI